MFTASYLFQCNSFAYSEDAGCFITTQDSMCEQHVVTHLFYEDYPQQCNTLAPEIPLCTMPWLRSEEDVKLSLFWNDNREVQVGMCHPQQW